MESTSRSGELSVGVRLLDCDHRALFETISDIQRAVAADEDGRRTGMLLRRLAGFTLTHFELEEEMMAATRYPELVRHRQEHNRIMKRMRELVRRHARGGLVMNHEAISVLSELHATHVQDGDLRYGVWLNEAGTR